MNLAGIQLQLMMGPTVPLPVPPNVAEALDSLEVTQDDRERSGFQVSFHVNHGGPLALLGDVLLSSPLFEVFNRVVITVVHNGQPQVIMDGFITNQEHQPGEQAGTSRLTLTGEDVSIMMDREERNESHPGLGDHLIALRILRRYARFGVIPRVVAPSHQELQPAAQTMTDLEFLRKLAARHAYRFFITPGPGPALSTAYWGPPDRTGIPQKALSANMGAQSNVESINFQHSGLAPARVTGTVQPDDSNRVTTLGTFASFRPPLASLPTWKVKHEHLRKEQYREPTRRQTRASNDMQARTEQSMDDVLTATGELDVMRYGELLKPRGLVGLRGVGLLYDGFYQVQRVSHVIRRGAYKQRFTLGREGLGTTTPVVRP